ncbi:hypothetical protein ACIBF5_27180 [Micromonospora sp. NPDC050417]|uniref:hypothetical protein n=1 Tax=Micromonospora sp. NPDC050417 TaxID=3364280 RepID=UPI0037AE3CE8
MAWLNDEIADADRAWVAAHHSASVLLHHVDPQGGLTDANYQAVAQWLTEESRQRSPHQVPNEHCGYGGYGSTQLQVSSHPDARFVWSKRVRA